MEGVRHDSGFTLVELMLVVLIIGILVSIGVPVFNAAKSSAERKACFGNQRLVEGAVQTYSAATGVVPAAGPVDAASPLVTNSYLSRPPECPLGAQQYAIDAAGAVTVASLTCGHPHY